MKDIHLKCLFVMLLSLINDCRTQQNEVHLCEKPKENQTNFLHNCISDSILFPSNRATCDYCNKKSIQIVCKKNIKFENKWFKLGQKKIYRCKNESEVVLSSSVLKCKGLTHPKLKCPNMSNNTMQSLGARTVCRCTENCKHIILECNRDTFWYDNNNKTIDDICSNSNATMQEGSLRTRYIKSNKSSYYVFECNHGYKLTNGEEIMTCNDGMLQGKKPTCHKIAKNMTEMDEKGRLLNENPNNIYMIVTSLLVLLLILCIFFTIISFRLWYKNNYKWFCFKRKYNEKENLNLPFANEISIEKSQEPQDSLQNFNNPVPTSNIAGSSSQDPSYLDVLTPYKYDYVVSEDLKMKLKPKVNEIKNSETEENLTKVDNASDKYDYVCPYLHNNTDEDAVSVPSNSSNVPELPPKYETIPCQDVPPVEGAQYYENMMNDKSKNGKKKSKTTKDGIKNTVKDENHYEEIKENLPLPQMKKKK